MASHSVSSATFADEQPIIAHPAPDIEANAVKAASDGVVGTEAFASYTPTSPTQVPLPASPLPTSRPASFSAVLPPSAPVGQDSSSVFPNSDMYQDPNTILGPGPPSPYLTAGRPLYQGPPPPQQQFYPQHAPPPGLIPVPGPPPPPPGFVPPPAGFRESYDSGSINGVRPFPAHNPRSYGAGMGASLGSGIHPSYSNPNLAPAPSTLANSPAPIAPPALYDDKEFDNGLPYKRPRRSSGKRWLLLGALVLSILLIATAVVVPVYFTVIRPQNRASSPSNGGGGDNGDGDGPSTEGPSDSPDGSDPPSPTDSAPQPNGTSGGDESVVTTEDGTTFTYHNQFGGNWYFDPNDPFNNAGARAQAHTPPLSEPFPYGLERIRGVNVGGWLTIEPFISPALFQKYPGTVDEWTLSEAMAADTGPGGGLQQIEEHYRTFITEEDFARIAGAGLNFVRIPISFWAIETYPGEPFLPEVSWRYFLKAIQWARKYGLRINLDLHALPGSQNGWNHSSRLIVPPGAANWLNGVMGLANAQRSLNYVRIIAEFISQPQYRDVVVMFGIVNEPRIGGTPLDLAALRSWYYEAYNIVRTAGGVGAGNGPFFSIHDGFFDLTEWTDFFPGADRMAMDTHPYLAFNEQTPNGPASFVGRACVGWQNMFTNSLRDFGLTTAGEWSLGINDCGLYLNGVGQGLRYEGTFTGDTRPRVGSCTEWTNYEAWTQARKDEYQQLAMASMDALQNAFFWTWKIGPSAISGRVETPGWSYSLGLEQGWMPPDPRSADGACGGGGFPGPLRSNTVGGAGAGDIPPGVGLTYPWPPTGIDSAGDASTYPTYTATGPIPTLPAPTFTRPGNPQETFDAGTGWNNPADQQPIYVPIAGCSYPDAYDSVGIAVPPLCT